jgi:hypothetical protein
MYNIVACLYVTATNITRGLDRQLDLLGTVTVALNYSVYNTLYSSLQFIITLAESSHSAFTASLA